MIKSVLLAAMVGLPLQFVYHMDGNPNKFRVPDGTTKLNIVTVDGGDGRGDGAQKGQPSTLSIDPKKELDRICLEGEMGIGTAGKGGIYCQFSYVPKVGEVITIVVGKGGAGAVPGNNGVVKVEVLGTHYP